MAARIGNGIQVEHYTWADCYCGTKEALIEAGLALPEWFPGDPACPRKHSFTAPDKQTKISRRSKRLFEVCVRIPEEERERRAQLEETREAARKAERHIASLPKTEDDFRGVLKRILHATSDGLIDIAREGYGGYSFGPDTIEAINDSVAAIWEAIDSAPVRFSATSRRKREREIRGAAMPNDPQFRTFLARILDGALDPGTDPAQP